MIQEVQCFSCTRLYKNQDGVKGFFCPAFPDGVPDDILTNFRTHVEPYPGDNGIRFDPLDKNDPWIELTNKDLQDGREELLADVRKAAANRA